jgi:hypothetical protein
MLNKITFLSVLASASMSVAEIPYNVRCTGDSKLPGVTLQLNAVLEEEPKLIKSLRGRNGSPVAPSTSFAITDIGPVAGGFGFKVLGMGEMMFAGGGLLTGALLFDTQTGRGTWKETFRGFDEVKGKPINETTTYAVTCKLAQ